MYTSSDMYMKENLKKENFPILHLFLWSPDAIVKQLDYIKSQGFKGIQLSPVQPLKEVIPANADGDKIWWLFFQPLDFSVGNQLISRDQLIFICKEAKKRGLVVISDVILNHLAGKSGEQRLEPHDDIPDHLKNNKNIWKPKFEIKNWDNRHEVITGCMGVPGIDINHPDAQKYIFKFLDDLIACGVGGFRFDAAKCMGLPSEGIHFWDVLSKRYDSIKNLIMYGEIVFNIKSSNYKLMDEYAENNIMVLTNYYDGIYKDMIVKLNESHDSWFSDELNKYSRQWSDNEVIQKYYEDRLNYYFTLMFARPWRDYVWQSEEVRKINNMPIKDNIISNQEIYNVKKICR